MKLRTAVIAGCLAWLAAPGAYAQAQSDMQLRMDAGFYIGAGIGRAEHKDFCNELGANIACDGKDFSWNVFAGYQFNRHFAVELGYQDFGKVTGTAFFGGAPGVIASETTAIELVAIAGIPLTDRFSVYAKGGFFRFDSDGFTTGAFVASANDNSTELTFGVGAEYGFTRNVGARFEYQRYLNVGSGLFGIQNGDIQVLRFSTRYRF